MAFPQTKGESFHKPDGSHFAGLKVKSGMELPLPTAVTRNWDNTWLRSTDLSHVKETIKVFLIPFWQYDVLQMLYALMLWFYFREGKNHIQSPAKINRDTVSATRRLSPR